ncbi:winged helix-turn-helix transcriptional regulator [Deinococcus humi]|uniref:DNA-binding HxlR family transcriptional regulator n=1 Tax=Deinococcus humi TaxID=662880 RepID=A0A7W8K341_9DEIO|nr:helix-turn-helix domain-containing protein [Deinococcus humi]MBB5366414.1 DNA-binding HxlR family transcriptional regulator [Deinococcus humi]GGO41623.1 transcriptional regulator [Deinococcus humi]
MAVQRSAPARRYHDGCAAAHALDLVGERWALLVVRELLLGPKRFSDLRADLPGISPNVLSQRLKDLEDIGVIGRKHLPPPAASWVYALSDWGRELEPVLQQLGRWGARSPVRPHAPITLATLVTAVKTMFYPPAAQDVECTVALRIGHERFVVRVQHGVLDVQRGVPHAPEATLTGDLQLLGGLLFGGLTLAEAETNGLVIEGNRAWAQRFQTLFQMPEVVAQS